MFSKDTLKYEAVPLVRRDPLDDADSLAAARSFLETMKTRHTIRDFADTSVAREVIETCIAAAGRAPSGANHQPWHFVAVADPSIKQQIRRAAEAEERNFYGGTAGDEWINALEPIGTGPDKPHLEIAPWLIIVFAQRWGEFDNGSRYKNYYVPESVGLATGFLITALHMAGLSSLIHTPNPMKFLNPLLNRPASEKPVMIIATGHSAAHATIPKAATIKKHMGEILTVLG
ncbi:nitroreductase family protein [Anderseniella sp. Alg231-50]|uniref:nitroreductase family protein n=1 Tax=Anderseniella sp. Alg231-50 TaxID=1922226 RepID=UPI000D55030A